MTTRDRVAISVLRLLCVLGIVAGLALVLMWARTHGEGGNLPAGIGGIGGGAALLRFTSVAARRSRSHD